MSSKFYITISTDALDAKQAQRKLLDTGTLLRNQYQEMDIDFVDMNKDDIDFDDMEIKGYKHHHRAFIKIEDGCNNFCSYCIIPYVRGRVRSKEFNKCLIEVNDLALSGHKEIVLSGIHTGQYNSDGKRLTDLIKEISKVDPIKRIRL